MPRSVRRHASQAASSSVAGCGQHGTRMVDLLGGDRRGVLGVTERPLGLIDDPEMLADLGDVTPPMPAPARTDASWCRLASASNPSDVGAGASGAATPRPAATTSVPRSDNSVARAPLVARGDRASTIERDRGLVTTIDGTLRNSCCLGDLGFERAHTVAQVVELVALLVDVARLQRGDLGAQPALVVLEAGEARTGLFELGDGLLVLATGGRFGPLAGDGRTDPVGRRQSRAGGAPCGHSPGRWRRRRRGRRRCVRAPRRCGGVPRGPRAAGRRRRALPRRAAGGRPRGNSGGRSRCGRRPAGCARREADGCADRGRCRRRDGRRPRRGTPRRWSWGYTACAPIAWRRASTLNGTRPSTSARSTPGRRGVTNHHVVTRSVERLARIPQPQTR